MDIVVAWLLEYLSWRYEFPPFEDEEPPLDYVAFLTCFFVVFECRCLPFP